MPDYEITIKEVWYRTVRVTDVEDYQDAVEDVVFGRDNVTEVSLEFSHWLDEDDGQEDGVQIRELGEEDA
jgi:hypothetical protein